MKRCFPLLFFCEMISLVCAQTDPQTASTAQFFEAENFEIQGTGWRSVESGETKKASLGTSLSGASGDGASTATQQVEIPHAGKWLVWVRYISLSSSRGPFEMDVLQGENVVATKLFDEKYIEGAADWDYRWENLEAELQPGAYTIRLRKFEGKAVVGHTRSIDAILVTDDAELVPQHTRYGPQTWIKVTLGDGYEKPVQINIFADHYRDPWYAHYVLTKGVIEADIQPSDPAKKLSAGETTGWLNITPTVYQDSGARLVIFPAYTYWNHVPRFKGTIEFAPKADDLAAVKKFEVDATPSTKVIVVPPNLETPGNVARLRDDLDFANEFGAIADGHDWPKIGKAPQQFPFIVTAGIDPTQMGTAVWEREMKTLSRFGFNGPAVPGGEKYGCDKIVLGGVGWHMKGSYSAPDMEKMRVEAVAKYTPEVVAATNPKNIALAMVMDEPGGEAGSNLANDAASIEGFRTWLKSKARTPHELLVSSWDEVKPVSERERDKFPALHYFTQQYRTVALGNFLAIQKQLLKEQWKTDFPVVANFSDGAVYYGNFYGQGVDYFTLLHETDQNAIWGEDWSNHAATYQDATYNVELMRAAARKNGQTLGHHLIAYAGRKGYDIRLKAISEAARGVKMYESFHYGPVWGTHEGSPWQSYPAVWSDHAWAIREIGAVEELLLPAQPQKAEVALLYSSASDAWTLGRNLAPGFDRMHTWLAFTHAQIPIDVVHEVEIADGLLAGYKVVYCSDPNITRAAANKLRDWVQAGGTLVLAAGAGERDEYNRPLATLDSLLPFKRKSAQIFQAYVAAGKFLTTLAPQGTVSEGAAKIEVFSVGQSFENVPQKDVVVEATFSDGSPAALRAPVGKGRIVARGYLPALDYMRQALLARNGVAKREEEILGNNGVPGPADVLPLELNSKSDNPWQYPSEVRAAIIKPALSAGVMPPIVCSVPLVDAVYMTAPGGILIPLANYSLQPIKEMTLEIAVKNPVKEVRSVHAGVLPFEKRGDDKIRVKLPLDCTDFLTIR